MPESIAPVTGYCTNVHAGTTLDEIKANLTEHAVAVRAHRQTESPLGIGLWIAADAAHELGETESRAFAEWLTERGLHPFTINGFPYGNFHQKVVKHRVYQPTWWETARRDYTLRLIEILDLLLPSGETGSISTLPIAWNDAEATEPRLVAAAEHLREVGQRLQRLEEETGRRICLAIEPEPGCVLQRTADVLKFFERFFDDPTIRRYLTVCHDVCHAAVMFESQASVIEQLADHGIEVGKFQISSAVEVRWQSLAADQRETARKQLAAFAEDRYLHQTCRLPAGGKVPDFVEDLPQIVGETNAGERDAVWRVHFHVPIYLEQFGLLHTTREEIVRLLQAVSSCKSLRYVPHFEAETYAWGVLPQSLRRETLAGGIADELEWLGTHLPHTP